jgi:ankyrin repeat protein
LIDVLLSDFHLDPSSVLDDQGNKLIHIAALQGHEQVVALLVKKYKCPIDSRGFKKRSSLHHALAMGHISTAKTLIDDLHLYLHCVDEDGNTPLHLSSLVGQPESVRCLLYEYHAPVYARNKAGKIALDLATEESTKK